MGSIKSKCGKNAAAVEDVNEEGGGIDTVSEATEVGGARNMGVNTNGELKKVMAEGRKEIKDAHEKLNSSLTTPVLSDHNGAEARVRYIKIIGNITEKKFFDRANLDVFCSIKINIKA